jgi:hypothetical protein
MYIMPAETISKIYFINPPYQLVCLYVYPIIVARQRLCRNIAATTSTHATIGEFLDASLSMRSGLYKKEVDHWSFPNRKENTLAKSRD